MSLLCCLYLFIFFFFKQKTAYEMRISDWSSDVCSSDLPKMLFFPPEIAAMAIEAAEQRKVQPIDWSEFATRAAPVAALPEQKTDETCYLQYSSGSTRFPHGVAVTHGAQPGQGEQALAVHEIGRAHV